MTEPSSYDRKGDLLKHVGRFHWAGVPRTSYKSDGDHWRGVSRTELVSEPATSTLPFHVRYFEIEPDGYSSLERHEHEHVVLVALGEGTVRIGDASKEVNEGDVVRIRPWVTHQFLADRGRQLGFYCIVSAERDRPIVAEDGPSSCEWTKS